MNRTDKAIWTTTWIACGAWGAVCAYTDNGILFVLCLAFVGAAALSFLAVIATSVSKD